MKITIGSRGSDLALYQANLVASRLGTLGATVDIKIIKTVGDKIDNLSFDKIEGKGFFTKELEDALLAGEIDLAVHSLKDLSTTMPDGLKVGAYLNPEDPSELLLVRPEYYDPDNKLFVKTGATIGTSSVRRQAQIAYFRPDLKIEPLRGNVPTRIKKLREGKYDAILLARAGVSRLGLNLDGLEARILDRFDFIPAPGQGILTIQIRDNDPKTEDFVNKLNEKDAEETARLERGLLAKFQGGCQLPLAVSSKKDEGGFYLKAFLGAMDGDGWGKPNFFEGKTNTIEGLIRAAYSSLKGEPTSHKKKVLITRNKDEASSLFSDIADKIDTIYYPVFNIIPSYNQDKISSIIPHLGDFDWLIFTSKNSVKIFRVIMQQYGVGLPDKIKVAAVGQKTKEALELLGIKVTFVPEREDSKGLVDEWPDSKTGARVLLPQGEEAPKTIEDGLSLKGFEIERVNIYKTAPTASELLPDINIDDIRFFIFTSPLSVSYFRALHNLPDGAWISAIGRPTAEALAASFRAPDFVPGKADLAEIVTKIREQI